MGKIRYIYSITFIGVITIFSLQVIWLYNTYILIRNEISNISYEILDTSLKEEVSIIAKSLPDGTSIMGGPEGDSISRNTYLYDGLQNLGIEFSISRIDSITKKLLKEYNINCKSYINYVSPKTNKVYNSSNTNNQNQLFSIKSKIIPTKLDLSQGMQLVLSNTSIYLIQRMSLLLIATLLMTLLVIFCITYQIKMVFHIKNIVQIREDFSYAMIHDMKTPLSTIFMTLNFLHTGRLDDKPEKKEKYFQIAESEADHLLTLTNKVLTISKLEQHKLEMHKEELELEPIIDKLIDKFTAKTEKPVHFIKDLQAEVIYADEEFIGEVLSNLIDNAIKYSNESVEITLSSTSNELYTILKVHDNGLGISDEDQKVIFNKYERAAAGRQKRKKGSSGFGLGLNFVQQVVEAHEGKIIVNSIEGEFTEFVIYLPQIIQKL